MIKFHLVKLDKEIIFQILDQSIRSEVDDRFGISVEYEGVKYFVKSVTHPCLNYLNRGIINIRGSDRRLDFKKCSIAFNNNSDRDKTYDIILTVLKKAFSNLDLFKSNRNMVSDDLFFNVV